MVDGSFMETDHPLLEPGLAQPPRHSISQDPGTTRALAGYDEDGPVPDIVCVFQELG